MSSSPLLFIQIYLSLDETKKCRGIRPQRATCTRSLFHWNDCTIRSPPNHSKYYGASTIYVLLTTVVDVGLFAYQHIGYGRTATTTHCRVCILQGLVRECICDPSVPLLSCSQLWGRGCVGCGCSIFTTSVYGRHSTAAAAGKFTTKQSNLFGVNCYKCLVRTGNNNKHNLTPIEANSTPPTHPIEDTPPFSLSQ